MLNDKTQNLFLNGLIGSLYKNHLIVSVKPAYPVLIIEAIELDLGVSNLKKPLKIKKLKERISDLHTGLDYNFKLSELHADALTLYRNIGQELYDVKLSEERAFFHCFIDDFLTENNDLASRLDLLHYLSRVVEKLPCPEALLENNLGEIKFRLLPYAFNLDDFICCSGEIGNLCRDEILQLLSERLLQWLGSKGIDEYSISDDISLFLLNSNFLVIGNIANCQLDISLHELPLQTAILLADVCYSSSIVHILKPYLSDLRDNKQSEKLPTIPPLCSLQRELIHVPVDICKSIKLDRKSNLLDTLKILGLSSSTKKSGQQFFDLINNFDLNLTKHSFKYSYNIALPYVLKHLSEIYADFLYIKKEVCEKLQLDQTEFVALNLLSEHGIADTFYNYYRAQGLSNPIGHRDSLIEEIINLCQKLQHSSSLIPTSDLSRIHEFCRESSIVPVVVYTSNKKLFLFTQPEDKDDRLIPYEWGTQYEIQNSDTSTMNLTIANDLLSLDQLHEFISNSKVEYVFKPELLTHLRSPIFSTPAEKLRAFSHCLSDTQIKTEISKLKERTSNPEYIRNLVNSYIEASDKSSLGKDLGFFFIMRVILIENSYGYEGMFIPVSNDSIESFEPQVKTITSQTLPKSYLAFNRLLWI
ncbi:TPA: hypothetical protein MW242_003038 [Acinetobacter baumannii]|nr:hypothetical protein [Acinetobacter baumannii]